MAAGDVCRTEMPSSGSRSCIPTGVGSGTSALRAAALPFLHSRDLRRAKIQFLLPFFLEGGKESYFQPCLSIAFCLFICFWESMLTANKLMPTGQNEDPQNKINAEDIAPYCIALVRYRRKYIQAVAEVWMGLDEKANCHVSLAIPTPEWFLGHYFINSSGLEKPQLCSKLLIGEPNGGPGGPKCESWS